MLSCVALSCKIGEYISVQCVSICTWAPESRYAFLLFSLPLPLLGFDEGSPDGHDPLQIARQMASRGITLVS